MRRASSGVVTNARTSWSSSRTALTSSSTSASTDAGTAPPGEVKSNRSRPGAFIEPACAAVSPSARRMPACTRCVAECDRETAARRDWSTVACAGASRLISPSVTVPRCTMSPATGDWTSDTSTAKPSPVIHPVSACWPPPSA